jgi:hypothetical protein
VAYYGPLESTTKDFTQVVREWNRSLSSNQTNTITFLKFAIKNQFTNLNKKEIIQELVEILDELKAARGIDTIAIAKRRTSKICSSKRIAIHNILSHSHF